MLKFVNYICLLCKWFLTLYLATLFIKKTKYKTVKTVQFHKLIVNNRTARAKQKKKSLILS